MPNYKTHLAGGCVAYLILLLFIIGIYPSLITASEWLLFALAGSLFPDVDTKSKGQKYFYAVIFILFIILIWKRRFQMLSLVSLMSFIPLLVNHRGIFHSFWFIIAGPLYLWLGLSIFFPYLSRPLFFNVIFFITGALSHIVLDRGLMYIFTVKHKRRR